jgi:hypothetical protein
MNYPKILQNLPNQVFEIYKCVLLTIIAIILAAILLKMPTPFTYRNIASQSVDPQDIPLVRVNGGHVNVENTVEIQGKVEIDQ